MNKNLEDGLILYAIDLIKKEVSPSEYYKDDLIKEIKTHGIDFYGYLEENGEWKLIDVLEQSINEGIRNWCEFYEKEFDKETILKMPLDKLSNSSRHTFLTIVPDDFPKCNDYKAEHFLRLLKMNVEDFIKLDFKEIHELPLCSPKLKEEKKETKVVKKLDEEVDKSIKRVIEQGVQTNNVDFLYKMIDIKKDIAEIEKEEENMMYRGGSSYGAGNYGRGSYRAGGSGGSYGEYGESGSYGRRGVPGSGRGRYSGGRGSGRYRGEEMMDEMMYHYGNYSESGQYGAENETMESLSNLMESAYEYFKDLKENANSPEEIKMMEHYFKKMGQM